MNKLSMTDFFQSERSGWLRPWVNSHNHWLQIACTTDGKGPIRTMCAQRPAFVSKKAFDRTKCSSATLAACLCDIFAYILQTYTCTVQNLDRDTQLKFSS